MKSNAFILSPVLLLLAVSVGHAQESGRLSADYLKLATWLIHWPERGGTRVITEEAQKGADAIKFRLEQPNAMYDGHDWWMSALKVRSERIAHPDKAPAE